MLIATRDGSFSVLNHQRTKNRDAPILNVIHLIIAGPDTEQHASKSGVYISSSTANGQICHQPTMRFVSSFVVQFFKKKTPEDVSHSFATLTVSRTVLDVMGLV